MSFRSWPEIDAAYIVRRTLKYHEDNGYGAIPESIVFRAKVKLHGTNAGIRIENQGGVVTVTPQSRTSDLTVGSGDNAGFAGWLAQHTDVLRAWGVLNVPDGSATLIFGEWFGPGIQKGVACATIPQKSFAIFALQSGTIVGQVDAATGINTSDDAMLITEPDAIQECVSSLGSPEGVYVLPWYGQPVSLDFRSIEALTASVQPIEQMVKEVESEDPWIKEIFGISGTGEGVVLYPVSLTRGGVSVPVSTVRRRFSELMFKAKGEKHQVKAAKSAVEVDATVAASVDAFAALFVTVPRCEQGLGIVCPDGAVLGMNLIGAFLKWMGLDVEKESKADLEASGLTWKQVEKTCQVNARTWFMNRVKNS